MLHAQPIALKTAAAPQRKYLVLLLILACGVVALQGILAVRHEPADPQWPTASDVYTVAGWQTTTPTVESAWGISHITRAYRGPDGTTATLVISTSPEAKSLYKSGADLAFAGGGYAIETAAPELVPPAPGRGAEILKREHETLLLIYTFGERRGLLGNGWLGWATYGLDTLVGRANDYYLLRVVARITSADGAREAQQATELADNVFPRITAWYASQ